VLSPLDCSARQLLAAGVQALEAGEWLEAQRLFGAALASARERQDDLDQVRALLQLARVLTHRHKLSA